MGGILYTLNSPSSNSEYYKLIDCSSQEECKINGKVASFQFTGVYNNGCHPDQLFGKVLKSITDTGLNTIEGCFRFVESTSYTELCGIAFEDFFYKAIVCQSCKDCSGEIQEEQEIVIEKYIPAQFVTLSQTNPEQVECVMETYANALYQEVMSKKLGLTYCCPTDLQSAQIDLDITQMDLQSQLNYNPFSFVPVVIYPNKTCVYTINPEFSYGIDSASIIIDNNEILIPNSGASLNADVYTYFVTALNVLNLGVWTFDYISKTISVTGEHLYDTFIYTSGNGFVPPPTRGLSYLFNPVCTLL